MPDRQETEHEPCSGAGCQVLCGKRPRSQDTPPLAASVALQIAGQVVFKTRRVQWSSQFHHNVDTTCVLVPQKALFSTVYDSKAFLRLLCFSGSIICSVILSPWMFVLLSFDQSMYRTCPYQQRSSTPHDAPSIAGRQSRAGDQLQPVSGALEAVRKGLGRGLKRQNL